MALRVLPLKRPSARSVTVDAEGTPNVLGLVPITDYAAKLHGVSFNGSRKGAELEARTSRILPRHRDRRRDEDKVDRGGRNHEDVEHLVVAEDAGPESRPLHGIDNGSR